jgi:hypothetical protein
LKNSKIRNNNTETRQIFETCFPLKWFEKNNLSPLLSSIALYYLIRKVQVKRDSLKLNGAYQLLLYADDVSILEGSVYIIKIHNF